MVSAMVGKILALFKELRAAGGKMVVCGMRQALAEELDALRLTRLFKAYATEQEAVAALAAPG